MQPEKLDSPHTTQFERGDYLKPGLLLDSRWEIEHFLGEGGMSAVYKAFDQKLSRQAVIKLLNGHLLLSQGAMERFRREALLSADLKHPNIIDIFGRGTIEGRPYIAMEYLEGMTLDKVLAEAQEKRLSPDKAQDIFGQICDALSFAHQKGIVHRDVKPSNVMLIEGGKVIKLLDFGVASILPESGKEFERLTQTGDIIGSTLYMSPEQCRGERLDARSDIYSLGCLMYEALTGAPPFAGDTPYAVLMKHLRSQPVQSAALNSSLGSVIMSTLAKQKEERPQSVGQLKELLLFPPQRAFIPAWRRLSKPLMATVAALALITAAYWAKNITPSNRGGITEDKFSGAELLEHGNYDLQRAESLRSDNTVPTEKLSRQRLAKQAMDSAYRCLTGALKKPLNAADQRTAKAGLARVLAERGNWQQSLMLSLQIAASPPPEGKMDTGYKLGLEQLCGDYTELGRYDLSVKYGKQLIDFIKAYMKKVGHHGKDLGYPYMNLGTSYRALHMYREAADCFKKAAKDNPAVTLVSNANHSAGLCYLELSKLDTGSKQAADIAAAREAFQNVIDLDQSSDAPAYGDTLDAKERLENLGRGASHK